MRVGLLGGTFDPIHAGHLDLARWCSRELGLDCVRFLTTGVPPHKPQPIASPHHRHAMTALATAPHPDFVADPRELARGGTTYTVDTLAGLRAEAPGAELVFLAGADSLRDLRTWRDPDEILRLAVVAVVAREGVDLEAASAAMAAEIATGRVRVLAHRPPPWSSTSLRAALRDGEAPKGALPDAVADYIRKNGLYAAGSAGPEASGSAEPASRRTP
jgi:nicotinate-nucleotide adenylyltransferase